MRAGIVLRTLAACALAIVGAAAAPGDAATATAAADPSLPVRERAVLMFANRPIITLTGPIAGYSARDRVEASVQRIERALDAERSAPVTMQRSEDGTQVLVGGRPAFLVTAADIDPQIGETTDNVAREAGKRLQQAIVEHAEQRTPRYMLIAAAWVAGATILALLLLRGVVLIGRFVGARLSNVSARRTQALHVQGVRLFDARHVDVIVRRSVQALCLLFGAFVIYGWLTFSMTRIPYTRPWGEQLEGRLVAIVLDVALSVVQAIPGLVIAFLILVLARAITQLTGAFFDRIAQGRMNVGGLDADTAAPTRRITNIVVWLFALALAYPYLPGAQTDAFKGLSVLVGLMVSIGASGVVGQAASGLILMYTRTLRVGEFVRVADTEGTVVGIGLFTTRVRTGLGEEVLLPNTVIVQNATHNYSRVGPANGCVIDTVVTIGYSTPWRQVHAMLLEAARRLPDIAAEPAAFVRQTALSDFYVEYRLIAQTVAASAHQRADVLNRLHATIQDVFNENGVQIMSPHYMLDPPEPQIVPKARWNEGLVR